MKGWRRIGIIASVIWFFSFGVLLWNQFVEDAVAPYAQDLKICSAIEQYSDEFWQANARDSEELSEKLQVNQDEYEKCAHQKPNCNGKLIFGIAAVSLGVTVSAQAQIVDFRNSSNSMKKPG